jgi:hypothetical protein
MLNENFLTGRVQEKRGRRNGREKNAILIF